MKNSVKGLGLICLLFVCLLATGCGGGGGSSSGSSPPDPQPQAATKAVVSYSVTNSASSPLAGIQFSAYLPPGTTVATTAGTNQIATTNLVAGSALSGLQVQVFGSYSAPLHKVKLGILPTNAASLISGFSGGELLKLTCNLTDTSLSQSDFTGANGGHPVPQSEIFGYAYDTVNKTTVDLNGFLTPSLAVTLN